MDVVGEFADECAVHEAKNAEEEESGLGGNGVVEKPSTPKIGVKVVV